ncbi:hypothetical protein [Lactococcus cremoris]|uniref:Uncharacterized protein n=3 Tax=Lactococcus lactis subsp. cremoris TaxID=1359 RepID=A0A1E7G5I6_LACLC|nr:hypothetical protein [Lactococcus cremoris]MCI1841111.1 hypothetical protein [Lactococcus lactis]KEY62895.1 hypothetical protein U725_00902 [Lactococcus cremoris subsp. cremoris GE214]KKW73783.1 hypothetical protein VN93_0822 [Lactococcus cremoris]KZK11004.1 hypothetical protein V4_0039 [Lactococcus cremoris]MCT0455707.1 hypothetical protein [Lactococcus cremoris]
MGKLSLLAYEKEEEYINLLTHKVVLKTEEYQLYVNGIKLDEIIDEKLYLKYLFLSSLYGNRLFLAIKSEELDDAIDNIILFPKTLALVLSLSNTQDFQLIIPKITEQIILVKVGELIYINRDNKLIELNNNLVISQNELRSISAVLFLPDYCFMNYKLEERNWKSLMDNKVKAYYDAEEQFDIRFYSIIENIVEKNR